MIRPCHFRAGCRVLHYRTADALCLIPLYPRLTAAVACYRHNSRQISSVKSRRLLHFLCISIRTCVVADTSYSFCLLVLRYSALTIACFASVCVVGGASFLLCGRAFASHSALMLIVPSGISCTFRRGCWCCAQICIIKFSIPYYVCDKQACCRSAGSFRGIDTSPAGLFCDTNFIIRDPCVRHVLFPGLISSCLRGTATAALFFAGASPFRACAITTLTGTF